MRILSFEASPSVVPKNESIAVFQLDEASPMAVLGFFSEGVKQMHRKHTKYVRQQAKLRMTGVCH
jgi:hypothetical protein